MNIFKRLDTWLIERVFEPILWRIEARTGWNNFRCAQILLAAYVAAAVLQWVGISHWFAYLMMLGNLMFGVMLYDDLQQAEQRTRSNSLNPLRVRALYAFFRLMTGLNVVSRLMEVVSGAGLDAVITVFSVSSFLFFYLAVCTPMPPGWKKPAMAPVRKLAIDHV